MENMTKTDVQQKIKKTASYRIKETVLVCTVTVRDVRHEYGRTRFQISPVAGSGETWVDESSLVFTTEKGKS